MPDHATELDEVFSAPGSWRSLGLNERLAARPIRDAAIDPKRGRHRLSRWQQQYRCDIDRVAARCGSGSDGSAVLLALLSEADDDLRRRIGLAPWWCAQWRDALLAARAPTTTVAQPETNPHLALIVLFAPLVAEGRAAIRRALAEGDRDAGPDGVWQIDDLLYPSLVSKLISVSIRTLVLEMNVARVEGRLEGANSEERFWHFVQRLREPSVAARLMVEYPVLARDAATVINRWVASTLELAQRLIQDWPDIRSNFSLARASRLESIRRAGDSHAGGRAVAILRFEGGASLVYNPRPVSALARFQDLLTWCNEQQATPPFRRLVVLERDGYGWIEYVRRTDCGSPEEAHRFYERQGAYLAMLYALGANDFHYENLIAAGEQPLLVDLETLVVPTLRRAAPPSARDLVVDQLAQSVLRTGLLPQHALPDQDGNGVDLSGLGGRAGQPIPFQRLEWENAWTDQMRGVTRPHTLQGAENLPRLGGIELSAIDYLPSLLQGFQATYRLFAASHEALSVAGGPLAAFRNVAIRVVLRPTVLYEQLLKEAYHPDHLRDALEREPLFDLLFAANRGRSELAEIVPWEMTDLGGGDIPIFSTRGGSLDLEAPGGRRLPGFFAESGFDAAARRLRNLNEDDLERQIWTIKGAFAAFAVSGGPARSTTVLRPGSKRPSADFIEAATDIGDRLEKLAFRAGDEAGWIGLQPARQDRWRLAPLGGDLYSGAGGIALYLAYLARVSGIQRYEQVSRAALRTAVRAANAAEDSIDDPGAFTGLASLIYLYLHLGSLWCDGKLLDDAEALRDRLVKATHDSPHVDIIAGCAGAIAILRALQTVRPSRQTVDAVSTCAKLAVARSQVMPHGRAWSVPQIPASAPLTGFSHGAAGIGWALQLAAALTNDHHFMDIADAAIAYERSTFSPSANNWPDHRLFDAGPVPPGRKPSYTVAWCHGAPGIGLARLRTMSWMDDDAVRFEIDAALATTENGFGGSHCLCHGDLGNLELLREAAARGRYDPRKLRRYEGAILTAIERDGRRCGVPASVETPGLMAGLAGIGYGLLRCAAPEQVPSVLMLDPPNVR